MRDVQVTASIQDGAAFRFVRRPYMSEKDIAPFPIAPTSGPLAPNLRSSIFG